MSKTGTVTHQALPVPKCIEGGVPPCPICPVQDRCAWAGHVLVNKDILIRHKLKESRK
jgi:hypothetical protein